MFKKTFRSVGLSVVLLILIGAPVSVSAENMFVGGTIEFVQLYNAGFTVAFRDAGGINPADGCQNERIYILTATHGEKLVDRAYQMAIAAFVNGKKMSIVIDKNINGPGGLCEATSGNMLIR